MATTILYVEDDRNLLFLVRNLLAPSGYTTLEATDGLTGVAVAAREHPDLILMDINLPGIDGLEATSRLKADPQLAAIPIVAVTAAGTPYDRETYFATGCDGYLPKPFTKDELLTIVARFLTPVSG